MAYICGLEDCFETEYRRGLCRKHYSQELSQIPNRVRCSVAGCTEPNYAKGLCNKHYQQQQKKSGRIKPNTLTCKIEGCTKLQKARGMCGMHYWRWNHHGDPNIVLHDLTPGTICSVDNCGRKAIVNKPIAFCNMHYKRNAMHGDPNILLKSHSGEGSVSTGYKILSINGRKIYEHILLAEKALGRPLPLGAQVHHMNENPLDNFTPFNLIICPDQAYHLLLHKRAREISRRNSITLLEDL